MVRFLVVIRRATVCGIGLTLMACGKPVVVGAQGSDAGSGAGQQIEAILGEKAARTPAQQKVSSRLLYAVKIHQGEFKDRGDLMRRSNVKVDPDGATLVDIRAEVTQAVLAHIEALGGTVISSFAQYQAIRARIPLNQIEALAEMPEMIFIRPADKPMTN